MTPLEPLAHTSPKKPEPAAPAEAGPSLGRLVGVDLARALAVFGMFAVHVGPIEAAAGDVGGWLRSLSEGRASALFATLAGFSLMLIAGRFAPKTGLAGRQAKARIVIRAVILLAVGTALTMTAFGDAVILNSYAVYFLLALLLIRLRARTLAIIAAAVALVAPQVAFGLRALLSEPILERINAYDPLERLCGVGVLDLLVTGFYPAITWMAFVIAGMALGRLDLAAVAVQRRLAVLGPALIVLGYGTSWLALKVFGGSTPNRMPEGKPSPDALADMMAGSGPPPGKGSFEPDPWSLLAAQPHSGSTFDIIGSVGAAITVLLLAMVAVDRLPWLRRLAGPAIAVGTMSLTIYVAHILVIVALPGENAAPPDANSTVLLLAFIVGAVVFAAVWSRFFRRGPLEYLLNSATKLAKAIR
jgi:uncharacterized membrane protein